MKRNRRALLAVVALALTATLPLRLGAQLAATETVDLDAIQRIKDEGFQRSKVMNIASYLTDVYGPRLTGSPGFKEAGDWAQQTMKEWGLSNVHTESFPFGRGWENRRFVANALTPRAYPLVGFPKAWTPGTRGPVTGEAVLVSIQNDADFATYKGTLRGKFALATPVRALQPQFQAPANRYTDAELETLSTQPSRPRTPAPTTAAAAERRAFAQKLARFWVDEDVAAVLEPSSGDGNAVFVLSGGSRNASDPPVAPQIVLAVEHYGRIARTLEKNIPVTLQMDVNNVYLDADTNGFNVIADIPGTDKADELVLLGAHFDSFHSATGATDNAAGSAIMMEAMRILERSGVRLRRTVRIGLWGGEEQGLLGSRQYIRDHLGDPPKQLKSDYAKFSVYFNLDNGAGTIRGVFLQQNEAIAPIFRAWMEPLRSLGMTTLAIRNTGGTDHTAFDAAGLPGFQFIQDSLDYETRTHHSSQDVYERIQPQDMMNNAVIVAAFALHAANRDQLLPRKPLPPATRN